MCELRQLISGTKKTRYKGTPYQLVKQQRKGAILKILDSYQPG
jgi:hypothetical protein